MVKEDNLYLQVKNLKKNFNHIQALCGVDLNVNNGEILAIAGDNGAGKSTLIKALSGVLRPSSGEIIINNISYPYLTPRLAGACGIATVYQDLALVNSQNVWENIFLGNECRHFGWLQKTKMQTETTKILEKLGIHIEDIDAMVGNLSGGQRQAVSVARALMQGQKLLIFDEPTAAMGYQETMAVQQLIQSLKDQGLAIIIISHNIQQVYDLADRICIMRRGSVVDILDKQAVNIDDIITMIISGAARSGVA